MVEIRYDGKMEYTIENIGFVRVERDENYTFPYRNGKNRNSFIIVREGSLSYDFLESNKRVKVKKGDILFIPKNFPYIATYLENKTSIHIFLFDLKTTDNDNVFSQPIIKNMLQRSDTISGVTATEARNTIYLASKIYSLIYTFKTSEEKIPGKYQRIMPAIEEFKERYSDNNKMSYYAGLCNMSESNFRKLFKEYTGISPIEYRNAIRISEAEKMIESGEFTVAEAAFLAGFNNMSFFYELYRNHTANTIY